MGDYADMIINGDMSVEGEWLGDGQGYPRHSDGRPEGTPERPAPSIPCPVAGCRKSFPCKGDRRRHMAGKHGVRFNAQGKLEPIPEVKENG
jgi:hypothetical protein